MMITGLLTIIITIAGESDLEPMVENYSIIKNLSGFVVFSLGGVTFCAGMKEVIAIINPNLLSRPVDLEGNPNNVYINNFKIPMLNLHRIFNIKPDGVREEKRILAVEPAGIIFGFAADKVIRVISESNMDGHIEFTAPEKNLFLRGLIRNEEVTLYMPDFKLLSELLNEE